MTGIKDEEVVEAFVATFDCFADLTASYELDPVSWSLAAGDPDEYGYKRWRPLYFPVGLTALDDIYAKLPARFPPLYERLILSYRWAEVDLGSYRLLANPPGPDLSGLLKEITKDKALREVLFAKGYLQFGRGPDVNYDPVCFEIGSDQEGQDRRVVRLDHEEILCNGRVKEVAVLAAGFKELVLRTIEDCGRRKAAS